jgi:hypothetical protein
LIGLEPYWQAHVSSTLSFVGVIKLGCYSKIIMIAVSTLLFHLAYFYPSHQTKWISEQFNKEDTVIKKMLAFFSLFLLLVACATTEKKLQDENLKPLSQSELEALYEGGPTVSFRSAKATGTVIYHTDGKSDINWGRGTDTGSYNIRDGKICTQWTKIRDGKEECFTIYKVGDNKYKAIYPNGSLNSDFSFK